MKAIFNREFNSYFTSMLGYGFLTIFLLLTGVTFDVVNIRFMTARMTEFLFQSSRTGRCSCCRY